MDTRSLGIEVSAATCAGRRRINADAFLIDEAAGLLAVTDGMGDEERSARVARMALDAVRERFGRPWSSLPPEDRTVNEAIERFLGGVGLANRRIHEAQAAEPSRIGTTFAGVAVCGPYLAIAHVGDSRAYLLRGATGELGGLTQDHTVLGDALWRGVPYETAAGLHKAHALTRTLGRKPAVDTRTSIAACLTSSLSKASRPSSVPWSLSPSRESQPIPTGCFIHSAITLRTHSPWTANRSPTSKAKSFRIRSRSTPYSRWR